MTFSSHESARRVISSLLPQPEEHDTPNTHTLSRICRPSEQQYWPYLSSLQPLACQEDGRVHYSALAKSGLKVTDYGYPLLSAFFAYKDCDDGSYNPSAAAHLTLNFTYKTHPELPTRPYLAHLMLPVWWSGKQPVPQFNRANRIATGLVVLEFHVLLAPWADVETFRTLFSKKHLRLGKYKNLHQSWLPADWF